MPAQSFGRHRGVDPRNRTGAVDHGSYDAEAVIGKGTRCGSPGDSQSPEPPDMPYITLLKENGERKSVREIVDEMVREASLACNGNIKKMAGMLGINVRTLQRRMSKKRR